MSLPEIDTLIFFFFNRDLQNRFFDVIMPFITGKPYLLIIPFIGWSFFKDKKKTFIVFVLALASFAISDWTSEILKNIFQRQRPCNALEGVHILVGCSSSYSMPSNHAINAFAFIIPFIVFLKGKIRYAFIIIASLVSLSRIYVGVHYPSDVLVGALLGTVIATSMIGLYKKIFENYTKRPYPTALFVFLLVVSLFRIYYILNGPLDLSPDEAHYWEWSRRLDWSYYSKGPMIAYLMYIGTAIFGDNVFGIRIMAVFFSALSSIFIYLLGKMLYDEKTGLLSAIIIQIIPLFSTFGIIFTIDSPFIFFWILSLFFFWKAINSQELGAWILLGLSIGLGLLTKYTMAFFYLCAFLFLLSKERQLLLTKGSYIAFIISLLVFSPVLLWNAEHNWVTLRHTAGQAHLSDQWSVVSNQWLKNFLEFSGSQIGFITPILFFMIFYAILKLKTQNPKLKTHFLFWFYVPVIAFFLLKSIHGKVQANWAMTGYITGIIAFSEFNKNFHFEGKGKKILVIIAVLLSFVVTSLAHYPSILNLPVKKDPTSRLKGWKELGKEVTEIYNMMSKKRHVFIFSDSYQVSSELAFYVKGQPTTYCIVYKRRMNQYDLWPGFQNLLHYDAIFVRIGDKGLPKKVEESFNKFEKQLFTAFSDGKKIRDYSIFMCYDFKGMKEETPRSY
ncbi:MAG: glycosyltransferase family 39 protein [Thermodesulfovibrionales bacterium]